MPRPLVFGNGSLLIGLDERYVIRDLYYPHVGHWNHLNGHCIRMGIWADGEFAWTEDADWERTLGYKPRTLVGQSRLVHKKLGLELSIEEAVSPRESNFIRLIRIKDLLGKARDVRVFFSHDLRIAETDIGDTAFYNPYLDAVIHYKGAHYFLFGGSSASGGIASYATGIKGFGGLEGTWRDAEDGELSGNPIAQGSVDSTFGLKTPLKAKGEAEALYWIVCGHDLEHVSHHHHALERTGFPESLQDAAQYWSAWSEKTVPDFSVLGECHEAIRDFVAQSLLIMRTQTDNSGAILAANDTDIMETNRAHYSYMWPRDGAFISSVFDQVGLHQIPRRFFQFCSRVLPKDRPVLLHKYRPDGTVGATWHPWIADGKPEMPFQEDETALTLQALWKHFEVHGDLEFLNDLFGSFVVPAADFIVRYRDPQTGLPLPSYDLWEERRGIHTFTVAAVIAGLEAAARIARSLGDERQNGYQAAADEVRAALIEHLYDAERGVFFRRLIPLKAGGHEPDPTIDAAVLQVGLLDVLPADDPMVVATRNAVEAALWVTTPVGGMARYTGDYYFRVTDDVPGNPWIICTLWLAQTEIRAATSLADLEQARRLLDWAMRHAATTGVLPEQVHPFSGEPLSVSPLTWSHAEFVQTALDLRRAYARLGGLA